MVERSGGRHFNTKPGDWNCKACGDLQFARNTKCRPRKDMDRHTLTPSGPYPRTPWIIGKAMVFWQQTCRFLDNRFGIMKFLAGRRQETKTASKDPDTNGEEVVLTHTSHLREFNLCHFFQLAEAIKSPKPPISFFFQTKKWDFQPFLGILGLQFFASTIITIRCRRCGAEKPSEAELAAAGPVRANVSPDGRPMRPGDWICPICADHVFAKNEQCRKCGPGNTDGPWERWATGPWGVG